MEWVIVTVVGVLILFVLGLLVWLIITNFAGRKELAGQTTAMGLLQQQLEALKAAQDKTSFSNEDNTNQNIPPEKSY